MSTELSFTEKCRQAGVNYTNAIPYRRRHPELTDEQVIEYYLNKPIRDNNVNIREICRKQGLDYNNVYAYKNNHPNLTYEEVIRECTLIKNKKSFTTKCEKAGISASRAYGVKRRYKDWSDEQVIEYCLNLDKHISLREACKLRNINNSDEIYSFAKLHPDLDNLAIVDLYIETKNNKEASYISRIQELGLSANAYYKCRSKFPDKSFEEIVEILKCNKDKKHNSFVRLCELANIDVLKAKAHKHRHPELSDADIIIHYNPNCYINIQGELVIPN